MSKITDRAITPKENEYFEAMLSKFNAKHPSHKMSKLRCAIYARKSQKDTTDTSLSAQIEYCRELIKSSNILEEVDVYYEDDVSGMWDDRPQFQRMFLSVEAHEIDVIVCMRWDRISRKVSDLGVYAERARTNDVYILAGDDSQVADTPSSKFCQTILWATNEFYAREYAERTMNSLLNSVKEGKYVSGKPPFGYSLVNGKVIPEPDEALVVSNIFRDFVSRRDIRLNYKSIKC